MQLYLRTHVAQAPATVMAGFTRQLFLDLAPPFPPSRLLRFDGCRRGDEVHIELGTGPLRQRWTAHITEDGILPDGTHYFVDQGVELPAPLREWQHRHLLAPAPDGGTFIIEDITYRTALAALDRLIYPALWSVFAYRRPIYRRLFGRGR